MVSASLSSAAVESPVLIESPSTSVSLDFMVLHKWFLKIIRTSLYLVEGLV